jgi:5,5'-dehydrodivanillate O-demethylase
MPRAWRSHANRFEENDMLTVEQNDRLTKVGRGTPMGELLRRYWYPIAATSELKKNPTKSVRLLGEDLVLYQDRSGTYGLIESACAHRRFNLLYGIPEEHGLRCPYHGWLYDENGQCQEMPAEAPDSTFASRVQLVSYPVEQLGGMIFAYLGPQPAPLVPRWDLLVLENVERDIGVAAIPCNWLQIMENSLDPVHTEWLHRYWTNYVMQRLGKLENDDNFWRARADVRPHVKIGFDVFEHGIVKRRVLQGDDEENPNWRLGHPILFPNILRSGTGGTLQIRVPVDDNNTMYYFYNAHRMPEGVTAPEQADEDVPYFVPPLPGTDEQGIPVWSLLDHNAGQDNVAWMSQGFVSERWKEKLGESDRGLIVYRRLLHEQIKIVQDGGEPMNTFRDPAKNECVVTPYEAMEGDFSTRSSVRSGRENAISTGNVGKYSPVNIERAKKAGVSLSETPPNAPRLARAGLH